MSIQRIIEGDTLILRNDAEGEILRLRETMADRSATVESAGRFTGEIVNDVQDELVAMALASDKLVLDMKAVDYISSAMLKCLLELQHLIDSRQGELILTGLSEQIYEAFEEEGLEDLFIITERII
ncbi:MAG: STAS domain-containing protein [Bacillota bacterium]|nr:STAS domain-containing protein [Bacillota bacterium]